MQTARPLLHYYQFEKWMNDPNGLTYHNGYYHLFYQCNPSSKYWGNIGWGHAISENLITWCEQPHAFNASRGTMIFSGSSVSYAQGKSDTENLHNSLLAFYTICDYDADKLSQNDVFDIKSQRQHLSISSDDGKTWQDFHGNPIVDIGSTEFRDPKVVQIGENEWLMLIARSREHVIDFYLSTDLIKWQQVSTFSECPKKDGAWECPDLICLDKENNIWCLLLSVDSGFENNGSGTLYILGNLHNHYFISQPCYMRGRSFIRLDHGPDFFAPQSFYNAELTSPNLMLGWLNSWLYAKDMPAHNLPMMQSIVRELRLIKTIENSYLLSQIPKLESAKVIAQSGPIELRESFYNNTLFENVKGTFHLKTTISGLETDSAKITFDVGGDVVFAVFVNFIKSEINVARARGAFFSAEHETYTAEVLDIEDSFDIGILVDYHSVEIFVNRGTTVMSFRVPFPIDGVGINVSGMSNSSVFTYLLTEY
ncbi:glycoside hydrolase family 32 protein [Alteromonas mediterranea]|uniref:glycoside hydrolase family 32 protein n=1 Tax=Alteromonas mediterranea TaxID=314275 RepID=UPI00113280F4|nr:glycoside hydrolase family 32 protein [Alteromonas mediterranea]QDG38108.1 glycoside hydrolase family 32 protein [Alteromonas mediterranea]